MSAENQVPAGGWLALLAEPAGELYAAVSEAGTGLDTGRSSAYETVKTGAGFLCGWHSGARPVPAALRVDGRLLTADGPDCRVSLLLLPGNARPIADDPAAIGARRAALRDGRLAVSLLLDDPVHLAGSLSIARADRPEELHALSDDPFARFGTPRLLNLGPGLFGTAPATPGPVLERYAGEPWPLFRWPGPSK